MDAKKAKWTQVDSNHPRLTTKEREFLSAMEKASRGFAAEVRKREVPAGKKWAFGLRYYNMDTGGVALAKVEGSEIGGDDAI